MAIDRGPWSALVDDDGSNLVGSVWNKAAIKTVILDPVDAAIAPAWVDVPFTAAHYAGNASAWTVAAADVAMRKYLITGSVVDIQLELQTTTIAAGSANLIVSGWPFTFGATAPGIGISSHAVGGWGMVGVNITGGAFTIFRYDFAPFPAVTDGLYVYVNSRFTLA